MSNLADVARPSTVQAPSRMFEPQEPQLSAMNGQSSDHWPGLKLGSRPLQTELEALTCSASDTFDVEGSSGRAKNGYLAAASVRGYSHMLSGEPKQDSFGFLEFESEQGHIAVMAVADGAGSKSLSHVGAKLAVRYLLDWTKREWTGPGCDWAASSQLACQQLADFIGDEARTAGVHPLEYSTTVHLNIVSASEIFHLSVGDGVSVLLHESLETSLCNEKFNSDETFFSTYSDTLPSHSDRICSNRSSISSGDFLVMATDGGKNAIAVTSPQFVQELQRRCYMTSLELIWHLSVSQEMCGDDRSALVWWHDEV